MMKIHNEDKYNDCYGRERMYMALMQKKGAGEINIDILKLSITLDTFSSNKFQAAMLKLS